MSVSQLATMIRDALAVRMPRKVRVVGEVSNFSRRTHWFFSLKDDAATIRCVCFASSARRVACPVEDGMQVVVTGRLDFFEGQGHVQLYVDAVEPVGQGALELRLRRLMEELRELGYFAAERKRPLPIVPCRVAVITSRTGAALQDVIDTAARRWAGCRIYLLDVRVQGAQAAPEIASAIDALSRAQARLGLDAILLTRGGGSMEDLWAFNERIVADAIFRCGVPIVAAIGHETDTTIAELVADMRCATPTQAVMSLVPDAAALSHQVLQLSRRMTLMLRRSVETCRHRLGGCTRHELFRYPRRMLTQAGQRLDGQQRRLNLALPRRVQPEHARLNGQAIRLSRTLPTRLGPTSERLARSECELAAVVMRCVREQALHLDAMQRQFDAISPGSVLGRGYSYTLMEDGRVLRSAAAATPGQRITTVLADGRVSSTVDGSARPARAPVKPPPRRRRSAGPEQTGLFT